MAKVVRFNELGGPEVLHLVDEPVVEPKANEVRLRVEAIGLNRAESMFRRGEYNEQPDFPSRIGIEAAGLVDAIGPNVTGVQTGDRVSVIPGQSIGHYGTYGEFAILPAHSVVKHPDNITQAEAAASWVQYLTGYFAFAELAHLQAGQHVLITAASSSTGLAAIELAHLMGATPIATTRGQTKKQALLDAGAHDVIVTDEENLTERVLAITSGKGAELIYDPVAGKSLESLAGAVAVGGQIVFYGALDLSPITYPLWTAFARNFTLRTYMIYSFTGQEVLGLPRQDAAVERGVRFVLDGLASGKLKPVISKTFSLDDIQEAHRYLESNAQIGKIVVTV